MLGDEILVTTLEVEVPWLSRDDSWVSFLEVKAFLITEQDKSKLASVLSFKFNSKL